MLVLQLLLISAVSSNFVISSPEFSPISLLPLDPRALLQWFKTTTDFVLDKSGGNTKCAQDLRAFLTDLFHRKLWAIQMLDASGKLNSGILAGNIFQMGNFDQCMGIHENRNGTIIEGQYCTIFLVPKSNMADEFSFFFDIGSIINFIGLKNKHSIKKFMGLLKIAYGVCLPQSCSIQTLQKIWDFTDLVILNSSLNLVLNDGFCYHKENPIDTHPIDTYAYLFFTVSIASLTLITLYDIFLSDEGRRDNLLVFFSVYSNVKKLLSTKCNNEDTVSCLSGIKVLSMFWVIQGHRYLFNGFSPSINSFYILQWKDHAENVWVAAAPLAVDSFLVISGFLVAYTILNRFKTRPITLAKFYLCRCIRLLPSLAAMMLFYTSIAKHLGDGPAWPILAKKLSQTCQENWWRTFFQISNLTPMQHQCIEQCWYLSVDTQLYFLSPLILFNIKAHPRLAIRSTIVFCLLSAIYTFGISYKYDYGSLLIELNYAFLNNIYMPTFIRMPPFLIGLLCGYFIHNTDGKLEIPKYLNIFLWILNLGLLLGIIGLHGLLTIYDDTLYSALFNAFAKQIWAIAVCWVIISCSTGNGGFINKFLSLPIFQIIGRLTYTMYLTHGIILFILSGTQKVPRYFSNIQAIHDFCGDVVFTIVASTILTLLFESPLIALTKYIDAKYAAIKPIDKQTNTEGDDHLLINDGYIFWALFRRNRGSIKID